ncbi:MAG TPA: hypothetical protein EYQ31_10850, partial [Candidatus Handelsmanbacteria bacterium]|nr:hypothetical protein [Candidatus Handelsmanbacteria bacterium]
MSAATVRSYVRQGLVFPERRPHQGCVFANRY